MKSDILLLLNEVADVEVSNKFWPSGSNATLGTDSGGPQMLRASSLSDSI